LVAVKLNEKWGFIDKNGDFVIKPKFDDIGY
ncbi:WG repeat-containing protein, partial [Campylobacter coli]